MEGRIVIDGGPAVLVEGRPAQGARHEVVFGVLEASGERVVVKLERIAGALERERWALEEIAAAGGPAPRVLASGEVLLGGERHACLVTERLPGEAPRTDDGWRRMGRAFARFGAPAAPATRLRVLGRAAFGREHARRVEDLGACLDPVATAVPDWERLASAAIPEPAPLVLTHGDPGPGNFLDDGGEGAVIDWEDAFVAPRGLDLARLAFIALLGSGPRGFDARDHRSRAASVTAGYLDALAGTWTPTPSDRRWWTTVAGVQFAHRRRQMGGPGPWEDAVAVLRAALTDADFLAV
ncbi:MAG: aminoglycoside phosphotransferase family protein [Actinobacteria bacterium]|nr:aminoglycoside phosphotransferase family protein [Actinomycetota bacterium]